MNYYRIKFYVTIEGLDAQEHGQESCKPVALTKAREGIRVFAETADDALWKAERALSDLIEAEIDGRIIKR